MTPACANNCKRHPKWKSPRGLVEELDADRRRLRRQWSSLRHHRQANLAACSQPNAQRRWARRVLRSIMLVSVFGFQVQTSPLPVGMESKAGSVFFLGKMQRPEHPPGSGLIALMCNGSLAQNCATGISKNGSNDAIWRLLGHGSVGGNPSSKEYWS